MYTNARHFYAKNFISKLNSFRYNCSFLFGSIFFLMIFLLESTFNEFHIWTFLNHFEKKRNIYSRFWPFWLLDVFSVITKSVLMPITFSSPVFIPTVKKKSQIKSSNLGCIINNSSRYKILFYLLPKRTHIQTLTHTSTYGHIHKEKERSRGREGEKEKEKVKKKRQRLSARRVSEKAATHGHTSS